MNQVINDMRKRVCEANQSLPKHGLVKFTWGNVSEVNRELGVIVIKPSGVDYDKLTPENMVVTDLDGIIIAQTHGHLFNINFSFQKLDLWAQEVGADICLYGHLHVPDAWMQGKTLFLNPGSISQPRGSINERLYAKVEIDDDRFRIDFYTRNHELYPSLSKEFAR